MSAHTIARLLDHRGATWRGPESTNPSKKKAKGEIRRTLFVCNLPYFTNDFQLSTVFEKYGGMKSCFTVKDEGGLQEEYFVPLGRGAEEGNKRQVTIIIWHFQMGM